MLNILNFEYKMFNVHHNIMIFVVPCSDWEITIWTEPRTIHRTNDNNNNNNMNSSSNIEDMTTTRNIDNIVRNTCFSYIYFQAYLPFFLLPPFLFFFLYFLLIFIVLCDRTKAAYVFLHHFVKIVNFLVERFLGFQTLWIIFKELELFLLDIELIDINPFLIDTFWGPYLQPLSKRGRVFYSIPFCNFQ